MAWTDRYVTHDAAGGGDGASGTPWTFAEAVAAAAPGDRVNVKTGDYGDVGTITLPSGSNTAAILFRGYNATIGDLDSQGRNANGTLNTTNFPVISITGAWVPGFRCYLQNFNIDGAVSAALISTSAVDSNGLISCAMINTANNAAAGCYRCDNYGVLINCDLECSGAAHGPVAQIDLDPNVSGCRFKGVESGEYLFLCQGGAVMSSVFVGASGGEIAIGLGAVQNISAGGNTFYNLGTAVQLPNSAWTDKHVLLRDNLVVSCLKWLDNLYAATSDVPVFELNNRLRSVTTPRTGILSIAGGENTTAVDDFVNAATGDFRLLHTSPALGAGMVPYASIGALQRQENYPAVADVEDGVLYGPNDEYEGTLAGGGGAVIVIEDE